MIAGVLLVIAAASAAAPHKAAQAPDGTPSAAVQSLVQNCDAHKFETVITIPTADGSTKSSKVKLCGTEGQSDADWLATLKDAVDKTAANPRMPQVVKDQIVTAVNAEIARLQAPPLALPQDIDLAAAPPPPAASAPPSAPLPPISRDYTSLPPLPTAPTAPPPHLLGSASAIAALARPKMSFQCLNTGDIGAAPCTDFERDTLITVEAGEDLPAGTALRFIRGDKQADVDLAQLRRGRSVRLQLPRDICAGVGGGRLSLEIVRTAPGAPNDPQVVGSEGPYNLRC